MRPAARHALPCPRQSVYTVDLLHPGAPFASLPSASAPGFCHGVFRRSPMRSSHRVRSSAPASSTPAGSPPVLFQSKRPQSPAMPSQAVCEHTACSFLPKEACRYQAVNERALGSAPSRPGQTVLPCSFPTLRPMFHPPLLQAQNKTGAPRVEVLPSDFLLTFQE